MPERKNEDNYEKLYKKLKKIEKKLRRRCRDSSSSPDVELQESEPVADSDVSQLLDGSTAAVQDMPANNDATATTSMKLNLAPTSSGETAEPVAVANVLPDSVILEILGEDPTISNSYGTEIHKDLAIRLEHVATHGLTKESRKEITDKYLLPDNCRLINAPALNAEIKAAISDANLKRDKSIEIRQKQTATAISCISRVINKLISSEDTDSEITKRLMDAERILCDSQYSDSIIRRNFILSSLNKEMKDQLQNTKPDNLLFGQNLSETIKTAKAISKSGAELKTPIPKQQQVSKKTAAQTNTFRNLNWKGPFPARKQTNHPKTKGPPPNDRPSNSSKHSGPQPKRSRR